MRRCEFLGSCSNNKFLINGAEVFNYKWRSNGNCVTVIKPETKKTYVFKEYQIEHNGETIFFIAGRFNDEEWGFYRYLQ